MGALDIRYRSARLGNLGDVASVRTARPVLDNTADMRRRANDELFRNLANGAQDAVRTGSGLLADREKRRAKAEEEEERYLADLYANKFQENMLLHNQGDGKESAGAMTGTIPANDHGKWMDGNREAARRIHGETLRYLDISEERFSGSRMERWRDSFMLRQGAEWLGKYNSDMKAHGDREAESRYANDRADVTGDIVSADGWRNISDSMERLIRRRGYGPEQAAAFRRREGETICGIGIKKMIDATTEEAVAAGADGGAKFDKLIADLKANPGGDAFIPPASDIEAFDASGHVVKRNPLRQWLDGADMKKLTDAAVRDAQDAKARWKTGWDAGVARKRKETVDSAYRSIIGIYTGQNRDGSPVLPPLDEKDPKSVEAHYSTLSRLLEAVGTNQELVAADPALAKGLVASAHAMAQKGRSDAQKIVDQRVEQAFLDDYDDPSQLGWMAEDGFHRMTPGEAIRRAADAHSRRMIGDAAYTKCLRACSQATDSQNKEFLDAACEAIGYSCPGIFSSKHGEIVLNRSMVGAKDRRNPDAAKTGVKRIVEDRWIDTTEDVTLGQLRKTLSLFTRQIVADEKAGKWNEQKRDEYLQKFKELVRPTVEDWQKRRLQERLDEIDAAFGQPRADGGSFVDDIRLPR